MKKLLCTGILLIATMISYAQNLCDGHEKPVGGVAEELLRGRLKKDGQLWGNPYTLINRVKYPDANEGFKAIRKALQDKNNTGLRTLYKDSILAFANKPLSEILAEAENEEFKDAKSMRPSPMAKWAKYNAFVFVIGLDGSFNKMAAGSSQRIQFRNRAMDAFKNMNCRVYGKDFSHILHYWFVPGIGLYAIPSALAIDWWDVNEKLQGRAFEVIMYCEAYDWLKASAHEPELVAAGVEALKPYDEDANGTNCMPRDNLRLFARNFYIAANGLFGPIESPRAWKKNRGIICASAIGMASVVLNDAGVETNWFKALFAWVRPAPNYSPVKWDALGQKCWENLLEGKHFPWKDVPQTNADGSSGYAEGLGYFNHAMSAMLPYARAYENWGKNGPDKEEIIKNMQLWQERVSLQNGEMPTYDDTDLGVGSVGGLYGTPEISFDKYYTANTGLAVDYIALMSNKVEFKHEELTVLENSGNIICISASLPVGLSDCQSKPVEEPVAKVSAV